MISAAGLVLDTSVWINLLATEQPWEILRAFGKKVLAPEIVVAEVIRNPITNLPYNANGHPLRQRPEVDVIDLNEAELQIFLSLVQGAPSARLGDGEAATIAVAVVRGLAVAIDERKARRILRDRFADIEIIMTAQLLRSNEVISGLGEHLAATAFAKARQFGRMHILK